MTGRDVLRLGFQEGRAVGAVLRACAAKTVDYDQFIKDMKALLADPESFRDHPIYAPVVEAVVGEVKVEYAIKSDAEAEASMTIWGAGIDKPTLQQMRLALRLPVAVGGALMPVANTPPIGKPYPTCPVALLVLLSGFANARRLR